MGGRPPLVVVPTLSGAVVGGKIIEDPVGGPVAR